jgi:hypothetical protein
MEKKLEISTRLQTAILVVEQSFAATEDPAFKKALAVLEEARANLQPN